MFTRTNLGLASEHLFYNVDLIIYCEGAETEGEAATFDELFWERIFTENGKNVHCKSLGSKSILLPIARNIAEVGLTNVAVALDRDYDDLQGSIIDHPQVFYTFGYSWESDLMLHFSTDVAISLFASTKRKQNIKNDFEIFQKKQSKLLRRIFAIDFKYIGCADSLFDRRKPMSIIATPSTSEPYIKPTSLLIKAKNIGKFQTAPLPKKIYQEACGIKKFYGKAISRLFYHWFLYRSKRINGSRKATYESFIDLLINTGDFKTTTVERNLYYSTLIARI